MRGFTFRRRPVISGPVGPVLHNGEPVAHEASLPSTAVSYATAYPTYTINGNTEDSRNDENYKEVPKSPDPETRIPKSRTMTVLSSLTQSFSRSSIKNLSGSRHPSSGSSASTTTEPMSKMSRLPRSSTAQKPGELQEGAYRKLSEQYRSDQLDPRLVYTAQPSSYWTGRFVSLRDQLYGEQLARSNLDVIVEAYSHGNSTIPWQPSTGTRSTSTYQPPQTRAIDASKYCKMSDRHIPLSSTSGTVMDTTKPGISFQSGETGQKPSRSHMAAVVEEASMLTDDNIRCKRALSRMEALCVTAEARTSMHAWQCQYARQTKRAEFLPRLGVAEDPRGVSREKDVEGFVTRWFNGKGAGGGYGRRRTIGDLG